MGAGLAHAVIGRPRAALALGCALLAGSALLAVEAPERLAAGSLALAEDRAEPDLVVRTSVRGDGAGTRAQAVALDVIASQLRAEPEVATVRRVSAGDEVAFEVGLLDASPGDQLEVARRVFARIDPGPLRIEATGELLELDRARERVGADLWRLELLALPLVGLLALWALGAGYGLAALAAAALAVTAPVAVLRMIAGPVDPSLLAIVAAAPTGFVLALEGSARLAARGGRASAVAREEAVASSLQAAGRFAAGAVIAPLALLATPFDQAPSVALGCGLGALFAALGVTLFAAPALTRAQPAGPGAAVGRRAGRWVERLALGAGAAIAVALTVAALELETVGLAAPEGRSLAPELPAAAGALALIAAVAAASAARSARWLPLGLVTLLPVAGGLGAAVLLLQGDGGALGLDATPALETGAVAVALAVVAALTVGHLVEGAARGPGGPSPLPGAALAALGLGLATGVLLGADEPAARQFGLIVAVGALLELLLVRRAILLAAPRLGDGR